MQTDFLLNQSSERETNERPRATAVRRPGGHGAEEPWTPSFRQAHDILSLGDRSSCTGDVRKRVVARAGGGTELRLLDPSAPTSQIIRCHDLGCDGAPARLAADEREAAAFSLQHDEAPSRNCPIE